MRPTRLLFLLLAGCVVSTDGLGGEHEDAGFDAGQDAGGDAGVDGGHDAGVDAGQDAGVDAGFDAGFDAGPFEIGSLAGLRLWVDANDFDEAASDRWVNKVSGGAGDLVYLNDGSDREPSAVETAGRVGVQFDGTRMETDASITEGTNEHLEFFVVLRVRELPTSSSALFETSGDAPVRVRLPDDAQRYSIALAVDEAAEAFTGPFGRNTRDVMLWHFWHGTSGGGLEVDGIPVRVESDRSAVDLDVPLVVGGALAGDDFSAVDLHELLVFDEPLDASARAQVTDELLQRWSLTPETTLPVTGAQWALDARSPLRSGAGLVDGETMTTWEHLEPSGTDAVPTSVTWHADGLGSGIPSVRTAGTQESRVRLPDLPNADQFTIFVLFATDDTRATESLNEIEGHRAWWEWPVLVGSDSPGEDNDGAIVLRDSRVGVARSGDVGMNDTDYGDYVDGEVHMLSARLRGNGSVDLWMDGVRVSLDDEPSNKEIQHPDDWYLAAHTTFAEGRLAADYGAVFVYTSLLEDEELSRTERFLRAGFALPALGDRPTAAALPVAP